MPQSQWMELNATLIITASLSLGIGYAMGRWTGPRYKRTRAYLPPDWYEVTELKTGLTTMREFCRERGTEWYFKKRLPPE